MNAMIADMPSQSSRVDPERQQHIIDAALRVIASRGVAGTSHRVVAAEAHVPLGSMTYYFDGMHDLLHQAFDQFARASVLKFAARMQSASTVDEACDAIALSIERDMLGNQRDLNINLEFYTLAARDLSFRDISDRWMSATQKVMGRFFDSETTVLLDAMIEGLTLHRALGGEPRNPQSIPRRHSAHHRPPALTATGVRQNAPPTDGPHNSGTRTYNGKQGKSTPFAHNSEGLLGKKDP